MTGQQIKYLRERLATAINKKRNRIPTPRDGQDEPQQIKAARKLIRDYEKQAWAKYTKATNAIEDKALKAREAIIFNEESDVALKAIKDFEAGK